MGKTRRDAFPLGRLFSSPLATPIFIFFVSGFGGGGEWYLVRIGGATIFVVQCICSVQFVQQKCICKRFRFAQCFFGRKVVYISELEGLSCHKHSMTAEKEKKNNWPYKSHFYFLCISLLYNFKCKGGDEKLFLTLRRYLWFRTLVEIINLLSCHFSFLCRISCQIRDHAFPHGYWQTTCLYIHSQLRSFHFPSDPYPWNYKKIKTFRKKNIILGRPP